MSLPKLLNSAIQKASQWMEKPCRYHGGENLGRTFNWLLEKEVTELRIQFLFKKFDLIAQDLEKAFNSAVFELSTSSKVIVYYVNGKSEPVSPRHLVEDYDPENGPERVDHFIFMLKKIDDSFYTEEDRPAGEWCLIFAPFNGGKSLDTDTFAKWRSGKGGRNIRTKETTNRRYRVYLDDLPAGSERKDQREEIVRRTPLKALTH